MAEQYPEPSSTKAFPVLGGPYFVPGVDPFAQPTRGSHVDDLSVNWLEEVSDESSHAESEDFESVQDAGALGPHLRRQSSDKDTEFNPDDAGNANEVREDDSISDSSIGENYANSGGWSIPVGRGQGRGARGRARGPGRPRGRGRGRGGRPVLDSYADLDLDLFTRRNRTARARPRGEGRGPGRRGKYGPRVAPTTNDFNVLQAKASTAFIEKRYEDCAQHCIDAIELNPEIFVVHSLLSQAYAELGRKEDSIEVLFNGALTRREASAWKEVAERIKDMLSDDQAEARDKRLLHIYSNILRLKRDDYESRMARIEIFAKREGRTTVINECLRLLTPYPNDLRALRILGEACLKYGTVSTARPAWEAAIPHYISNQSGEDDNGFTFDDLNLYLEILKMLKDWQSGLREAKRLARWLLKRKDDMLWDIFQNDDREWDDTDEPRRVRIDGFVPEKYEPEQYGQGLPADIRVKLGLFRLNLGLQHFGEALHHFEAFDEENIPQDAKLEFADLLRDISAALHAHGHHADSLRFFRSLENWPEIDSATVRRAGLSAEAIGDAPNAVKYLEQYLLIDARDTEMRLKVAAMQERLHNTRRVQIHVEGILLRETVYSLKSKKVSDIDATTLIKHLERRVKEKAAHTMGLNDEEVDDDVALAIGLNSKSSQSATTPQQQLLRLFGKLTWKPRARKTTTTTTTQTPLRPIAPALGGPPSSRTASNTSPVGEAASSGTAFVDKYWRRTEKQQRSLAVREAHVKKLYGELQKTPLQVKDSNTESRASWMTIANQLCDEFFDQKTFFTVENNVAFSGFTASERVHNRGYFPKSKDFMLAWSAHLMQSPEDKPVTQTEYAHLLEGVRLSYGGISFPEWLSITLQTCMNHAQDQKVSKTYYMLDKLLECNMFTQHPRSDELIHLAYLACAMTFQDNVKQNDLVRYFINNHSPHPDSYRLLQIVNRAYLGNVHSYSTGPQQKYVARLVRAHDYLAMTISQREKMSSSQIFSKFNSIDSGTKQVKTTGAPDRHPDPHTVDTEVLDPQLLVIYGNMIAANNSHQINALNYYMRACAAQEDNPLAMLSASVAHMAMSMKRLNPNRHHQVLSAVATMMQYKAIRMQGADGRDLKEGRLKRQRRMETEYNEGRLWHYYGLMHLAAPCYERILAMAEESEELSRLQADDDDVEMTDANTTDERADEDEGVLRDEPDFTMEAALALQSIYVHSGNLEGARELGERWLVF